MTDVLQKRVSRVVSTGNCTGCGGCTHISERIRMEFSNDGFMRPTFDPGLSVPSPSLDRAQAAEFDRMCPGRRVDAPAPEGRQHHPVFGPYVSAWQGWARDEDVRFVGSSGGVLTALSGWLLETHAVDEVVGVEQSQDVPRHTIPKGITNAGQITDISGSRYAPVAALSHPRSLDPNVALVGKPCEATAARKLIGGDPQASPVLLSFFCAGTPSQLATDKLVRQLGMIPEEVTSLDYRGEGWPGSFRISDISGRVERTSYEESWGATLGRQLQSRCKICVDGTGGDADIAVGDYWQADENGYPVFTQAAGNSVVIARTARGHDILMAAAKAGVVVLSDISLDDVEQIQPLQSERKRLLAARLGGRMFALRFAMPKYRKFGLLRLAVERPKQSVRALVGSFVREVRARTRGPRT